MSENENEIERLERIIIEQQNQLKRLEVKLDRLLAEYAERGRVNARLNKENDRLKRLIEKKGA